jgi:putative membrane protein
MTGKYIPATLALLVSLAAGSLATAADTTGDQFIKEAIQGNLAEVKVGQLAQEKGASQGVKDFGNTLVTDHQTANEHATEAAQQMSVTPPDKPGLKQEAVYKKLSMLSGEHFDREFIKSMVKDHQEDIAKYQQEAQQSGPAADYAKKTLPKLREHLKMAEKLERSTQVAGTSGSTSRS